MIIDSGDILIELKAKLRNSPTHLTLLYDDVDEELDFVSGSTKTYIKQAAEATNYEVITEGSTRIELEKESPHQIRLVRG